jgi:hypothetical protein
MMLSTGSMHVAARLAEARRDRSKESCAAGDVGLLHVSCCPGGEDVAPPVATLMIAPRIIVLNWRSVRAIPFVLFAARESFPRVASDVNSPRGINTDT